MYKENNPISHSSVVLCIQGLLSSIPIENSLIHYDITRTVCVTMEAYELRG